VSTHVDGRFPGASGGEIYWQAWLPDTPSAVVLLSHGLGEHSGRYGHVADRLNRSAYALYAVDHRGHGKSDGTPGRIDSFAGVRADLDRLRELAGETYQHVPFFLLGHSLGGLIALDYATSGGADGLAGLLLSAAAIDPSVASRFEKAIAPLMSRIAPNLAISTLDPEFVSRDPAVVRDYRADPLNYHGKIRARTGAESLAAISRVVPRLAALTLPTLILHGSGDKLVAPAGSQLVADEIGTEDLSVTFYDGLFHEIMNEPEQDTVLDDIVAWLDAHA
jgi:acylglycerol lipase